MVSEFPGRNESERVGSLVKHQTNGRAFYFWAKAAFGSYIAKLTETRSEHWRGLSDSTGTQGASATGETRFTLGRKDQSKVSPITTKREMGRKVSGSRRGS